MIQDADAVITAPEFTCNHINTTATHCTFDKAVNGTLAILDWTLKTTSTAVAGSRQLILQLLILPMPLVQELDKLLQVQEIRAAIQISQ